MIKHFTNHPNDSDQLLNNSTSLYQVKAYPAKIFTFIITVNSHKYSHIPIT
jgi:hypothetical protein